MPAKYTNLKIESGATFSTTISLRNADKTALNLTLGLLSILPIIYILSLFTCIYEIYEC